MNINDPIYFTCGVIIPFLVIFSSAIVLICTYGKDSFDNGETLFKFKK